MNRGIGLTFAVLAVAGACDPTQAQRQNDLRKPLTIEMPCPNDLTSAQIALETCDAYD